jgi:hypothetical protein
MSERSTDLISYLAREVKKISIPGSLTIIGPLDMAAITRHLETTPLRQYSGSLTTPPCKEGITFLVAEQPLPINTAAFNAMKKVLKFNSRFTQGALGEPSLIEKAFKQNRREILESTGSKSSNVVASRPPLVTQNASETVKAPRSPVNVPLR